MKQEFSDRTSFLKAMLGLKEATFNGHDLTHDAAARSLTLTVTRADESRGGAGGFLRARKPSYVRTEITIRRVSGYRQSLTGDPADVYVLDRAEVGRGGQEIALFFRPGDRAVLDVDRIEGQVEDAGRATAAPRAPLIQNPLLKQEKAAGTKGAARRTKG